MNYLVALNHRQDDLGASLPGCPKPEILLQGADLIISSFMKYRTQRFKGDEGLIF
jgi:hypothetical protein